ncbi:MAG TPA: VOC family protein [Thermoplasmata archaeon]|nr:VOC family protein [Thermoplasmata archaeon]
MKALLTYIGIRVRDMDRSTKFYAELLGLVPIVPDHANPKLQSRIVMLRHPKTGQQLELNWYPDGGQFGVPFVAGESLDHVGVRVDDVPGFLEAAEKLGGRVHDMTPYRDYPFHEYVEPGSKGAKVGYVEDPDGNILEVYDAPGESLDATFDGGY